MIKKYTMASKPEWCMKVNQDLLNDCKEMENQGYTEQAKPDRFNDPIAKTTPWTPMIRGGSQSRTHRFHQDKEGNVQFKLSLDVMVGKSIPLSSLCLHF